MDAAQIERFRVQLQRLKLDLDALAETSREAGKTVVLDQTSVGRLSRMDAMQAQQMALETARRRRQQLAKVDGALRRMETAEYGLCFACGEEIDIRRLSADPTSTRCIDCVDAKTR